MSPMHDACYTIALEYCGHDTPRWVVRFCGDWVGQESTRVKAREMANFHKYQREALMTGASEASYEALS